MDDLENENNSMDEQDTTITASNSLLPAEDQKTEDLNVKLENQDTKPSSQARSLPFASLTPPEPMHSMAQWREALLSQPEWPTLPDHIQAAVQLRLKNTTFPAEPSGHTSWKHVKAMLKQNRRPDMVSLITATFIWRARRRRPGMAPSAALPDSFLTDAGFHTPPIDISTWPTRDIPGVGKAEGEVKSEEGEGVGGGPQAWAPNADCGREGTAAPDPSGGSVSREGSVRPATRGRLTGQKRARPDDEEQQTTPRPAKRATTTTTTTNNNNNNNPTPRPPSATRQTSAATAVRIQEWKTKFANADKNLAAATANIAQLTASLAETNRNLADATTRLDATTARLGETAAKLAETETEQGELRAMVMGNRRLLRRLLAHFVESTRSDQVTVGKLGKELKKLEENMG